ncbi:DUF2934 domain-containing protein [Bosea sp. Root381]|uniref:DUF2934 domain-containing protein n=1 Tax=Bosea sp. Root381 TaxID=1736524 RepID=UPI0009E8060B|nr:DUF2934 domain-containing protein [Bosea sp. Root381]
MSGESDTEVRIRQVAYSIWLSEGQPEGQEKAHWEAARAICARDGHSDTTRGSSTGFTEPAVAVEDQADPAAILEPAAPRLPRRSK